MPKFFSTSAVLISLGILVFTTACAASTQTSANQNSSPASTASSTTVATAAGSIIKVVDPAFAHNLVQTNTGSRYFMILDVRTPDEFNGGHIAGALNIDSASPDLNSRIAQLDTLKTYLVYCRTGVRSAAVVKIMADSGFKTVYDLQGGLTEWIAAGYPVVK